MTLATRAAIQALEAEVRERIVAEIGEEGATPGFVHLMAEQEYNTRQQILAGGPPPLTSTERRGLAELDGARAEATRMSNADPSLRNRPQAGSAFLRTATVKPSQYRDAVTATEVYAEAWASQFSTFGAGDEERAILQAGRIESRDLDRLTGASGAYAVPQAFLARLVKSLLNNSPIRGLATVIDTDDGRAMKFPTMDDTAQLATIVGETVSVSHTTDPTLQQASLGAWNFVAPAVLASRALVEDSGLDLTAMLGSIAGDRIGRAQEQYFVTGDGTTGPAGLAETVTAGVTTASTSAITRAELLTAVSSLRSAYRTSATRWLMNPTTLEAIWGITDSSGKFVFDSDSGKLFGVPYVLSSCVAAIGASKVVAYVGDFSGYYIRDVTPVTSLVLRERFAESLDVAVICAMRTDACLADVNSLASVVMHS